MNDGILPRNTKFLNYTKDHILITNGFSMSDFDIMEMDEYDFHVDLAIELKKAGKSFTSNAGLI